MGRPPKALGLKLRGVEKEKKSYAVSTFGKVLEVPAEGDFSKKGFKLGTGKRLEAVSFRGPVYRPKKGGLFHTGPQ